MRPQNSFLWFFLKMQLFFEKIVHQISDKKGYIHFWCKMNPVRSHSDTVGRVAIKVRVEGGEAFFIPYFYDPKYPSSDALPSPGIFFNVSFSHF